MTMRDRRTGTLLAALGVAMLVVIAPGLDLGAWPSRVELALGCLAVLVGIALVIASRPG